jgi:3-methyl-2-oxobutanoate hydroxymethyltransferase
LTDRVTVATLRERKRTGAPIAGLTAYDYPTAAFVDRAGLDLVLVGDSLGQLALGYGRAEDTTMDDMVHHCRAVSRAVARAMVVGDMPFGSYEVSPTLAVQNAVRLVHEGGVSVVKLEGGEEVVPAVRAITAARIPAFGHLAPVHAGHTTSDDARADALVAAALALEAAGVSAIVLVGQEHETARRITAAVRACPTIGFLSGPFCDGQLLVTPYMLGLLPAHDPQPGPYGSLGAELIETFSRFRTDALNGTFRGT